VDVATGAQLDVLRGHEGEVWGVAFFPDGKRVVSAAWDSTLRIWDVEDLVRRRSARPRTSRGGQAAVRLHGAALSTAASPDGALHAAGLWDGTVRLWDARTGASRSVPGVAGEWVLATAFSPGGTRLLAGGFAGGFALRDVQGEGGLALRAHRHDARHRRVRDRETFRLRLALADRRPR